MLSGATYAKATNETKGGTRLDLTRIWNSFTRTMKARKILRSGPVLDRLPLDREMALVEVGVDCGKLSERLLRRRPRLRWYGVDPWWHAPDHSSVGYIRTGDAYARRTGEAAGRCYRETLQRVKCFGERANVLRMASPCAASAFDEMSMDAVFLDADHSYDAVKADIAAWWPVVKSGGWIGGHDIYFGNPRFDFTGVDRAVQEFAAHEKLELELATASCWFVRKPRDWLLRCVL